MHTQPREADVEAVEPEPVDLEDFTCYEDGEDLVILDKQNPNAWIRSADTTDVSR